MMPGRRVQGHEFQNPRVRGLAPTLSSWALFAAPSSTLAYKKQQNKSCLSRQWKEVTGAQGEGTVHVSSFPSPKSQLARGRHPFSSPGFPYVPGTVMHLTRIFQFNIYNILCFR